MDHGSKMDLILNAAKYELIGHSGLIVDDLLLRYFIRVQPCDATLLGTPLFQGKVRCCAKTYPAGSGQIVSCRSSRSTNSVSASFSASRVVVALFRWTSVLFGSLMIC